MFKKVLAALAVTTCLSLVSTAEAAITGVSGPASSEGFNAQIIAPPSMVFDDNITTLGQVGFNESQGVTLVEDLITDQGVISAGTVVDSHFILHNSGNTSQTHFGVEWLFSGPVLGTMSDINGILETQLAANILRAVGTVYPDTGFFGRGLESPNDVPQNWDTLTVLGNIVRLDSYVAQPGDWIRVLTVSEVPIPGAIWLMLAGISGLGFARKQGMNDATNLR